MSPNAAYRPEIDGLRAIAVLSVLLFHGDFELDGRLLFSGGYLGVDIFFVISGYLITGILLRGFDDRSYSVAEFYERRIRRIFPVLLFISVFSIPFFYAVLGPDEFRSFMKSVIASVLSVSNFWFLGQEGDYWAPASDLMPFLHTWSLAVEEQFYLVLPPILLLIYKFRRSAVMLILTALAVFSLVVCEVWVRTQPGVAFYMLPGRGWELLAGSLMAAAEIKWGRNPSATNQRFRTVALLGGLVLLLGSIVWFDEQTLHPSLLTLVPVLGVSVLIWFAGGSDLVTKLLSWSPIRFIGLISYSLYLWHFPAFAFARYTGTFTDPWQKASVFAAVFVLSVASYYSIERPFRSRNFSFHRVAASLAAALFVVSGIGIYAVASDAVAGTSTGKMLARQYQPLKARLCSDFEPPGVACRIIGEGDPKFVVWGDSHASIFNSLSGYVATPTYMLIVHPGCPPISGVRRYDHNEQADNCKDLDQLRAIEDYIQSKNVDTVFLSARWTAYTNGFHRNDRLYTRMHLYLTDKLTDGSGPDESSAVLASHLSAMVKRFTDKGTHVVVVQQSPDFQAFSPIQSVAAAGAPASKILNWHKREEEVFAKAKETSSFDLVAVRDAICDAELCRPTLPDGTELYRDDNHISQAGASLMVFSRIKQFIPTVEPVN